MIWFGSSAGVAISNLYARAKSVPNWVKGGWRVIVAYIIGFTFLMLIEGWQPHEPHKDYDNKAKTEQAIEKMCIEDISLFISKSYLYKYKPGS